MARILRATVTEQFQAGSSASRPAWPPIESAARARYEWYTSESTSNAISLISQTRGGRRGRVAETRKWRLTWWRARFARDAAVDRMLALE